MARPKKDGTYLNVCIETSIYDELSEWCIDAGQSKTIVVERALTEYLAKHKKKQEMLRKLEVSDE